MATKEALKKLVRFYISFVDAKQPNSPSGESISVGEWISIGGASLGFLQVYDDIPEIGKELDELSEQSKQELKSVFATELAIANEVSEKFVERIFDWLVDTVDAVYDLGDIKENK